MKPEMQRMSPEDAAYVAGLLDGEGYFTVAWRDKPTRGYHYYRWEYRIVVSTTTKAFLEEVAALVPYGGGTVGRTARKLVGRSKPAWRLSWIGSAAVELCKDIRPYVRLKRKHVELILNVASAKEAAKPYRTGHGHRYPQAIADLMRDTAATFRELNKRGQDNAVKN